MDKKKGRPHGSSPKQNDSRNSTDPLVGWHLRSLAGWLLLLAVSLVVLVGALQ